ncbi:hypothetical protein AUJ61_03005 [Candidatus Pacearchaeota archaeon CG1_02_30_18]|nr:hypothetical protein [Candidatus Pacearchaeota archaeon]OIO40065.1 MAG: hypothetical protein AUJ61_03005 [Candidatus Pacearchaeota archaeon CG1_02_30_18]PJA71490.1 MAG: hypothetical protein CO153_01450 [Candidatus Pacearchaeota archaeon CG_4_9_14_3_um_filter_30_11]
MKKGELVYKMASIITSKTKLDPILGIERKFETNLEEGSVISFDGSFSSVLKVRDENGQVYAGKFPFKFNEQEWTQKDCPAMAEILIPSLNHENFISNELYNQFDLSLKPEGVFAIKIKEYPFFLPAFVNRYDESFRTFDKLSREEKKFAEKLEKDALRIVIDEGFSFYKDTISKENNKFYSMKEGFKFNDFGWWIYKNQRNPFPSLYKQQAWILEDYNEDCLKLTTRIKEEFSEKGKLELLNEKESFLEKILSFFRI